MEKEEKKKGDGGCAVAVNREGLPCGVGKLLWRRRRMEEGERD